MADEKEMMVQLAEMRGQMQSMATALEEIKESVKEVVTLDRTIAELSIHQQQSAKELQTQWSKIDEIQRTNSLTDRKVEEWTNKARGAWFTAVLLGSLAQAAVLGMIAWTFTNLRTAQDDILLMKERLYRIEQIQGVKK